MGAQAAEMASLRASHAGELQASREQVASPPITWGTSSIRNRFPVGPYSRAMPRALWWSQGGGLFLMSEVPL